MVSAVVIVGALQKQARDKLLLTRKNLVNDYATAFPDKASFWHRGTLFGTVKTGSVVIRQESPFYDRAETFINSLESFENHRSKIIAALGRLITRTPRETAGYVPSYLELAIKPIMDAEHHFPPEPEVKAWEERYPAEVRLMRFYSMSHVLM